MSDIFDKAKQLDGSDSLKKGPCRWDNFVQWIEKIQEAGSGKSTLMSYIAIC